MKHTEPYRVSVYTDQGTYLVLDREFGPNKRERQTALALFHAEAARQIYTDGTCVLLTCGNKVLASKSTNHHHVELTDAYYRRE